MVVYKRGRIWWYKFTWNGAAIRESTKQLNKRNAEQMEAAHKTSLAKGEVGIYTFRHTCLTRWAAHMDPYTLAYFAGHSDFGTTRRYVHPNLETGRAAMERAREAQGGHKIGHNDETAVSERKREAPVIQ